MTRLSKIVTGPDRGGNVFDLRYAGRTSENDWCPKSCSVGIRRCKASSRYVSGGAGWIWDRVSQLCEAVGYSLDKVTQVVDFYHAKQRLYSFADNVKSWGKSEKEAWLKKAGKLNSDALVAA